jgi:hypothetical protein
MTKKVLIALADAIREFNRKTSHPNRAHEALTPAAIEMLADFCKSQNSAFKYDRWLGYIAGTNGKNGGKVGR